MKITQRNKKIFEIKERDGKARVGILHTRKGDVMTPFFMPVATKATGKHLSSKDFEEMGCDAVISNSFILSLSPGAEFIKKLGGVGKFMNFGGVNVTDSGGFQMYSDKFYKRSNDEGAWFSNPMNGDEIFMTPEKNMAMQLAIGADIAMCLDRMPLIEDDKHEIEEAVRKTTLWARRCKDEQTRLQKRIPKGKRQILLGITQGGIHDKLRKQSASELKNLDFDGYAIGGLALGEEKKDEYRMIKIHKSIIGEDKITYLMGVGHPVELVEAISMGVDMFDSRFPTQTARHGMLLTSKGKLRIDKSEYRFDLRPIDENCDCKVCKNYSRAYVRYQLSQKEGVGYHLASYHNIYFLIRLVENARQAIKARKFEQFKKKIILAYKE